MNQWMRYVGIGTAALQPKGGWYYDGRYVEPPSHWQPLPEPPQEEV